MLGGTPGGEPADYANPYAGYSQAPGFNSSGSDRSQEENFKGGDDGFKNMGNAGENNRGAAGSGLENIFGSEMPSMTPGGPNEATATPGGPPTSNLFDDLGDVGNSSAAAGAGFG